MRMRKAFCGFRGGHHSQKNAKVLPLGGGFSSALLKRLGW